MDLNRCGYQLYSGRDEWDEWDIGILLSDRELGSMSWWMGMLKVVGFVREMNERLGGGSGECW